MIAVRRSSDGFKTSILCEFHVESGDMKSCQCWVSRTVTDYLKPWWL